MKFLYFNNQTAWQNRSTFAERLRHFDAKMHRRRVLLLLDNASCHYGAAECYNVKPTFLPPNMTAHLQALDAGKFEWISLDQQFLTCFFSDNNHTVIESAVSKVICSMAPGCNPHHNRPKVEYSGGCALQYINLGGGTLASD